MLSLSSKALLMVNFIVSPLDFYLTPYLLLLNPNLNLNLLFLNPNLNLLLLNQRITPPILMLDKIQIQTSTIVLQILQIQMCQPLSITQHHQMPTTTQLLTPIQLIIILHQLIIQQWQEMILLLRIQRIQMTKASSRGTTPMGIHKCLPIICTGSYKILRFLHRQYMGLLN